MFDTVKFYSELTTKTDPRDALRSLYLSTPKVDRKSRLKQSHKECNAQYHIVDETLKGNYKLFNILKTKKVDLYNLSRLNIECDTGKEALLHYNSMKTEERTLTEEEYDLLKEWLNDNN